MWEDILWRDHSKTKSNQHCEDAANTISFKFETEMSLLILFENKLSWGSHVLDFKSKLKAS
jgi:hypothetical protein